MRETSQLAYQQIKAEGLLTRARLEVYEAVCHHEPCTSGEAFASVSHDRHPLSQSRARFTELRDRGVIREVAVRPCQVSGRRCIVWAVTGDLPVEPENEAPSKPTKEEMRVALREVVELMRAQHHSPSDALRRLLYWMRYQVTGLIS